MKLYRSPLTHMNLAGLFFAAILFAPFQVLADTEVPESVAELLPPGLDLEFQSWGVFKGEEEFEGTTFTGQMGALFPGSVSCDITVGPNFNLELQGQTAWEASPEQLDMFVQMYVPDAEVNARGLPGTVQSRADTIYGELSIGEPRDEQLPNGHIVYVDFTWKCKENPGGENVMLLGFARRGATVLTFDFWVNGGVVEARAMATGILDRFEKLDILALIQ